VNRQMRRQMKREQEKQPQYNMTRTQVVETTKTAIAEQIEQTKKELSVYYTEVIASAFLINLHDKYGFGKKRMVALLESIGNTMDSVREGKVTVEDLVQICKEEFGIDIV